MALVAYQYVNDAGTLYQINVPADFAAALQMRPAVGNEPYIDQALAPRHAYFSAPGQNSRVAIISTKALLVSLPKRLSVNGLLYTPGSIVAESYPPYQATFNQVPQAFQAAPGTPGTNGTNGTNGAGIPLTLVSTNLITDFNLTATLTLYTVLSITLSAGTWMVFAHLNVSTVAEVAFHIIQNGPSYAASGTVVNSLSGTYTSGALQCPITITSFPTVSLTCQTFNAGAIVRAANIAGNPNATSLWAVRTG